MNAETDSARKLYRSFLFAPGNHARKVEKVFDAGADAVILDLEDAVATAEKAATRELIVAALARPRACLGYVRVNALATPFAFEDFMAVVGPELDGIVLPMAESAADLLAAEWLLLNLERRLGLAEGRIDLMPIVETAKGMAAAREMAAAGTRVRRLAFGAGDYSRDLGLVWSFDEAELAPARAEVVLASRLAGIEPPIDTVFIHIREAEHFRASAERAQGLGFQGKMCIHPNQVAPTNAAFSPTEEAVAWAGRIVAEFEKAEAAGSASIQVEGTFVDYPIVEKALATLAKARAIAGGDETTA